MRLKPNITALSDSISQAASYCGMAFSKIYGSIITPQDFMRAFFYGVVDGILEKNVPKGYQQLNPNVLDNVVRKHKKSFANEVGLTDKPSDVIEKATNKLRGAVGKALKTTFNLGKGLGKMCYKVANIGDDRGEKTILGHLVVNLTIMASYAHYVLSGIDKIYASASSILAKTVKMAIYGLIDGIHGSMEHDPRNSDQMLDAEAAKQIDKALEKHRTSGLFKTIWDDLVKAYRKDRRDIADIDELLHREGGDLAKAIYHEQVKSWDVARFVAKKYSGSEGSLRKEFINWYDRVISGIAAAQNVAGAYIYSAAKLTGAMVAATVRERTKTPETAITR